MNALKIKETKKWDGESVRAVCINNRLYTRGNSEDYDKMLNQVDRVTPDLDNIFHIAEDIMEHSEDQTLSNIMFLLANKAVTTFYDIEGEDE